MAATYGSLVGDYASIHDVQGIPAKTARNASPRDLYDVFTQEVIFTIGGCPGAVERFISPLSGLFCKDKHVSLAIDHNTFVRRMVDRGRALEEDCLWLQVRI